MVQVRHTAYSRLEYVDLPADVDPPIILGYSLRDALQVLRRLDWGERGTMRRVCLSDGDTLSVELEPASDGGVLLSSQRAVRRREVVGREVIVRKYYL